MNAEIQFIYPEPPLAQVIPLRASDRSYTAPWLRGEILRVIPSHWVTCEELVVMIFGPRPESWEEAFAANKVWTQAKALWEDGHLDRQEGSVLRYRRVV